jgi:hypothetical protein
MDVQRMHAAGITCVVCAVRSVRHPRPAGEGDAISLPGGDGGPWRARAERTMANRLLCPRPVSVEQSSR